MKNLRGKHFFCFFQSCLFFFFQKKLEKKCRICFFTMIKKYIYGMEFKLYNMKTLLNNLNLKMTAILLKSLQKECASVPILMSCNVFSLFKLKVQLSFKLMANKQSQLCLSGGWWGSSPAEIFLPLGFRTTLNEYVRVTGAYIT